MGNELIKTVKDNSNEILVVSSRNVADNFGKRHSDVLRTIESTIDKFERTENCVGWFIEGEYIDNKGESRKEYLLTRDGFSLIVMGFTGKKAFDWKIKYINAFNDMEDYIKNKLGKPSYLIEDEIERAKKWIEEQKEKRLLEEKVDELYPLAELAKKRLDKSGTVSITDVTKTFDLKRGQITTWAKVKGFLHKRIKEVNKDGEGIFKVVDANGYKNITVLENGLKVIEDNLEEIKSSPTSYVS